MFLLICIYIHNNKYTYAHIISAHYFDFFCCCLLFKLELNVYIYLIFYENTKTNK